MNTLFLKYAIEVEHAGSITQAADNLFMGQPNLSKAIKELEDTLGISIFKRTSKGVVPTQTGKEFLRYAKNILSQIDAMEKLHLNDNPDKQSLSIVIPRSNYLSKVVTNFVSALDNKKAIDIHVEEVNAMQAINYVAEGIFNFGIIRYNISYEKYFFDCLDSKGISHNLIWEFQHLAVMSKNHILAHCNQLKFDDLKDYIEIIHDDLCVPYINAESTENMEKLKHSEKRVRIYEHCCQFDLLSKIPNTYMFESPLPEDMLNQYNLIQKPCQCENNDYKDVLIYNNGYSFNTLDKNFMDKLYEIKNEVSLKNYL